MTSTSQPSIAVIEPTWNNHVHFPGNLGLLRTVLLAYPDAAIHFVGGEGQIALMKQAQLTEYQDRITYTAWPTGQDRDSLPTDGLRALGRFKQLPIGATTAANKLFFCSVTASALNAVNYLGLAAKSYVMLHGNANDLSGWRSRNPFRRHFDFRATLERYCRNGGHTMALEDRIVTNLSQQYPWMAKSISCLPHPLTPEEATPETEQNDLSYPIRIGFAGNASLEKGFADFIKMADEVTRRHPGKFAFHAVGRLANDARHLDQASLSTKASSAALPREQYVEQLRSMHFIFTWHYDTYYGNAASGVVYDAINFSVPLIARHGAQLSEWQSRGLRAAFTYDNIEDAIESVASLLPQTHQTDYEKLIADTRKIRQSLSLQNLANTLSHTARI